MAASIVSIFHFGSGFGSVVMIGPSRLERSIRVGRLPLGDAALRVRATSKTLQQPCSHAASMLYNRRGADFLCYIAASKMAVEQGRTVTSKLRRTHLAGRGEGQRRAWARFTPLLTVAWILPTRTGASAA